MEALESAYNRTDVCIQVWRARHVFLPIQHAILMDPNI